MTSDELEHLVMLQMMSNDEITGKYLSSLQDKYAPTNTGGDQLAGAEGIGKLENPVQDEYKGTSLITPDQSGDQEASNTGNTGRAPDTGGNTTVTPIPEQNKDDLAYLAEGRYNRLPIPEPTVASNGLKVESNSKYTPGAQGFRPNAGIEPKNSKDLFERSIATKDPKVRLSIDSDGKNSLGNRELGSFNKEIKELKGK